MSLKLVYDQMQLWFSAIWNESQGEVEQKCKLNNKTKVIIATIDHSIQIFIVISFSLTVSQFQWAGFAINFVVKYVPDFMLHWSKKNAFFSINLTVVLAVFVLAIHFNYAISFMLVYKQIASQNIDLKYRLLKIYVFVFFAFIILVIALNGTTEGRNITKWIIPHLWNFIHTTKWTVRNQ